MTGMRKTWRAEMEGVRAVCRRVETSKLQTLNFRETLEVFGSACCFLMEMNSEKRQRTAALQDAIASNGALKYPPAPKAFGARFWTAPVRWRFSVRPVIGRPFL